METKYKYFKVWNQCMTRVTINILFFGLISNLTFSQTTEIKGRVIDYKSLLPLSGVSIQMTDSIRTITDLSAGEFRLSINKQMKSDSLSITFIGNRPLIIKRIPLDKNTIDLGTIPLFEGDDLTSLVDFFCSRLNFICRLSERRYWKKERLKSEQLRNRTNLTIKEIRYLFNGYIYNLDYYENEIIIDLSKPIDKWTN